MLLDNLASDGQPESNAKIFFGGGKWHKNLVAIFPVYTRTVIANPENNPGVGYSGGKLNEGLNVRPGFHRFDRIPDNI
jgi:hypothetical protein